MKIDVVYTSSIGETLHCKRDVSGSIRKYNIVSSYYPQFRKTLLYPQKKTYPKFKVAFVKQNFILFPISKKEVRKYEKNISVSFSNLINLLYQDEIAVFLDNQFSSNFFYVQQTCKKDKHAKLTALALILK